MIALALALCLTAAPDTVVVTPGGQQVLQVPGLVRVAVGDAAVADVTPTARGELLVVGQRKGRTSLTVWTRSGVRTRTIVVEDGSADELGRLVHSLINPSLTVHRLTDRVVVDGELDSLDELRRLKALLAGDPNVTLLVRLNPRVLPVVAQVINTAFTKAGIPTARASAVGGKILLEGSVADEQELRKALFIARAWADPVSNLSSAR